MAREILMTTCTGLYYGTLIYIYIATKSTAGVRHRYRCGAVMTVE